jgi:hypothetical protein
VLNLLGLTYIPRAPVVGRGSGGSTKGENDPIETVSLHTSRPDRSSGCAARLFHEPKTAAEKSTLSSDVDPRSPASRTPIPASSPSSTGRGLRRLPFGGQGRLHRGGSYGKGELFDHGVRVGYCDLSQATIGLQAGAETYDELISSRIRPPSTGSRRASSPSPQTSPPSPSSQGAAGSAKLLRGVAVFNRTKGGLMAEAAVGGQKFSFKKY